ncbi:uncharacterized protein ABDE67_004545 [Symphorus nematophorus]
MVMAEISLYVLLGHLLIAGVGSVCFPVECLRCNVTGETPTKAPCLLCSNPGPCINITQDIPPPCKTDFKVYINSTGSTADEGDDITLTCVHKLPNLDLKFVWMKDKEDILVGQNKSELVLKKVFSHNAGKYTCRVESPCGNYTSSPHDVTVNNGGVLLLVICGISAVALILVLGLAMKFKLKRDNAKHRERRKQRAQAEQNVGPAPFTPRES